MRLIAIVLALVVAAGATAADGKPDNRLCICGKPIDPRREPVVIRLPDGRTRAVAICSAEDAAKLKAMLPAEAVKAVEAANRGK